MIRKLTFDQIEQIADSIKTYNNVVVIETDTVMGVVSSLPEAIYEIKQRPAEKKLIYFIHDIDQVPNLTPSEKKVISKYWPGALTVIKGGVSYRVPNHKNLLKLIDITGPLYSSSANISGQNPIKNSLEAEKVFSKYDNGLTIVKGKKLGSQPSTVINLDTYTVVRQGKYDGKKIIDQISKGIKQKIYIASDHAGYEMKKAIISTLKNKYEFKDLGPKSTKPIDYPLYAFKVGEKVKTDSKSIGVLICGTGFGMCIAANKIKGIRAVTITDPKIAAMARLHNNCNVITLSARFNTLDNNIKIINNFMDVSFDAKNPANERHIRRLKLISDKENKC